MRTGVMLPVTDTDTYRILCDLPTLNFTNYFMQKYNSETNLNFNISNDICTIHNLQHM